MGKLSRRLECVFLGAVDDIALRFGKAFTGITMGVLNAAQKIRFIGKPIIAGKHDLALHSMLQQRGGDAARNAVIIKTDKT